MHDICVSPNERKDIKTLLGEQALEVQMPYDFRIYSRKGIVAMERKRFPQDCLASIEDGRLAKECAAMRSAKFGVLIVEGTPRYNRRGYLKNGNRVTRWTAAGIRNMLRSVRYVEGIDVEYTKTKAETIQCIKELQIYFDADTHFSMRVRPSFSPDYLYKTPKERYIYWLQGLPGIGYTFAIALSQHFSCPTMLYSASEQDLRKVPGIGSKMSKSIYTFLHEGMDDYGIEDVLTK